jgi:hypothetical protein
MQVHPCDYGYLLLAGALDQSGDGVAAESARRNAELLSRNLGAAQRYANELLSH